MTVLADGRVCTKCYLLKPYEEFYKDHRCKSGYRSACKLCINKDNRERRLVKLDQYSAMNARYWASLSPDERRARHKRYRLKSLYGITVEEYDRMLTEQDGKCAICGLTEALDHGTLAVDHDHKTNEVRGLLCFNCNTSIGKLEAHMDRVIEYLRKT